MHCSTHAYCLCVYVTRNASHNKQHYVLLAEQCRIHIIRHTARSTAHSTQHCVLLAEQCRIYSISVCLRSEMPPDKL